MGAPGAEMTPSDPPLQPGESFVEILGRSVRVHSQVPPEELARALSILEETYGDMERAYELRWGCTPSLLGTSNWLLMGALNLAHRVVRLEQEASRHTQDLEQTLSKLLDDVPLDISGTDSGGDSFPSRDGKDI
jgi:cell division protein ZapA (FtsZ GTPase activity inhibitor)